MKITRTGLLTSLVFCVVFSASPVKAVVQTSARDAVVSAYVAEFARVEPPSGWAGNVASCSPGTTSEAFQSSVLKRVNFYRSLAGLPDVAYDASLVPAAQAAAAYQSNAGTLSHNISPGTACYSELAASGSASSNLALGSFGVDAIDDYIFDFGANNVAVGHRNWILSPTLAKVATGDVPATPGKYAANALHVTSAPLATPATPRDGFIAWPYAGFFPDAITPARWSFRLPSESGVSYASAQVTLTSAGRSTTPTVVNRYGVLVFEPGITASVDADTSWTVNISGITGAPQSNYSYTVTIIDVPDPVVFRSTATWSQSTCASPGSSVVKVSFTGSPTSFSLVPGEGSTDNNIFSIDQTGLVTTTAELPTTKTTFSVRIRAQNSAGFSAERVETFELVDANSSSVICPVRNLTASMSGGKIAVRFDAPRVVPSDALYHVYSSAGPYCSATTTTGCTLVGAFSGVVTITVNVTRGKTSPTSPAVRFSLDTLKSTGEVSPQPPTTTYPTSLKTGVRYKVSHLMKLSPGSRRITVSGGCKLSADQRVLRAATKRSTCTLKVITTRKTTTGVSVSTVRKKFSVR